MLTRKDMLKCQKMVAYLEIYDKLIGEDTSNFLKDRQRSDEAHKLLIEMAGKALNDKDIAG